MPQAEKPNTPIPSRRAFLTRTAPVAAAFVLAGGATAVEAAVAPVVEPIPAAPPAADPIFALIKRHRAAIREEKRTHDIFQQFATEHPSEDDNNRGVVIGERPVRSREIVRGDGNDIYFNYPLTGKMEPVVVFNEKLLASYAPIGLTEADRDAWIKEKTKELRRNRRAYDRRNNNPLRNGAWEAWNEAEEVTNSLSQRLIETSPTTVAGVAALLAHWSNVMDENQHDRDFISTAELLKNLAKGVKAIA